MAKFALTPGRVDADDIIDYRTREGRAIFRSSVTPFMEPRFNLERRRVPAFIFGFSIQAHAHAWEPNLWIPLNIEEPDKHLRWLPTQYGEITEQQIRDHSLTYLFEENRQAQNNFQIFTCLMGVLTENGRNCMVLSSISHQVKEPDPEGAKPRWVDCGALLLKQIFSNTSVDNGSTTSI